uniref:WAP domain-containing protein n=1 Tax=Naja naja TaxID=35670 RepID=A0A8C6XDG8_NAJNA
PRVWHAVLSPHYKKSCPKLPPGRITICTLYCRYDWQCPRREKCCTYGCTAVCKDPV